MSLNQIKVFSKQKKGITSKSQWELKGKPTKLPKARENAGDQGVIGLSFASDWWREWYESLRPITEQSKAKPIPIPLILSALNLKLLY